MVETSLAGLSLKKIMRRAYERHVAVPAFNIPYLPMVKPVAETLKKLGSFALIQVALVEIKRFGSRSFTAVAEEYRRHEDRGYMRLHQDHVPVIDEDYTPVDWRPYTREALAAGFDSVMIDGSRLPLEENIAATKAVVAMAHPDVPVEAELGSVLGHEEGPLPSYEELFQSGKGFTNAGEAERFVRETGADWLSVACGNIHGAIRGVALNEKKAEARLHLDLIRALSARLDLPLVLHGGSGINLDSLLAAIACGITKINVGMELRQAYTLAMQAENDSERAREAVAQAVTGLLRRYRIEGSAERLAVPGGQS